MPNTFAKILRKGTSFNQASVVAPLCCPSRASIITGQYPHNTGVLGNNPGYPGLRDKRSTLPVWLQAAGYETVHVGKWLHGYEHFAGAEPAPGWDTWLTQLGERRYYDYDLSINGRVKHYGTRPREHLTRVLNAKASRSVARETERPGPFFLEFDAYAPHRGSSAGRPTDCKGSAVPLPRDAGRFAGERAPRLASFDEHDMSDKPPYVSQVKRLNAAQIRSIDRRYRCGLQAAYGVDRGVGKIVAKLKAADELGRTAFFFLTDNGTFYGEHRFKSGKSRPYEEAVRTPFAMRLPNPLKAEQVDKSDAPVASIDIAPTILELAGARPCDADGSTCRRLDGRSLIPPARGNESHDDRGILIELDTRRNHVSPGQSCAFDAIRTTDDIYIRDTRVPTPPSNTCSSDTTVETYDLGDDPYELDNLAEDGSTPPPGQARLAARLAELRSCSGIEGRDPPSSEPYCE